jgi:hypothetical protein
VVSCDNEYVLFPFTAHHSLLTNALKNHFETPIKIAIFASELKKRGRLSPLLFYQSIPIAIGRRMNEY